MEIAFLLHLYQPITQDEATFRKIYKASYAPLIRKIGKSKDFRISLDIPLSLLEQMDRYGYSDWISDVKELVRLEKVELVGSAAYHPLLAKLTVPLMEQQILLNEYGLGYYLGEHKSLEGDPAIMVKNVRGFFPPEMAVNEDLLSLLDSLGYTWMAVDEASIPFDLDYRHKFGVYHFKDYSAKVVCRNRSFSNMLSFKRDLDMGEIIDALSFFKANEESFAVVLDAEFFGHHFSEGFILLDRLVEHLRSAHIKLVTVSEYVKNADKKSLSALPVSSWGATDENMESGEVFPLWQSADNEIQAALWDIVEKVCEMYRQEATMVDKNAYSVLPIWDPEGVKKIKNPVYRKKIARDVLMQKALHSDQFWWASNKSLPVGDHLYSVSMIKRALKIWEELLNMYNDDLLRQNVAADLEKIRNLLQTEK